MRKDIERVLYNCRAFRQGDDKASSNNNIEDRSNSYAGIDDSLSLRSDLSESNAIKLRKKKVLAQKIV